MLHMSNWKLFDISVKNPSILFFSSLATLTLSIEDTDVNYVCKFKVILILSLYAFEYRIESETHLKKRLILTQDKRSYSTFQFKSINLILGFG